MAFGDLFYVSLLKQNSCATLRCLFFIGQSSSGAWLYGVYISNAMKIEFWGDGLRRSLLGFVAKAKLLRYAPVFVFYIPKLKRSLALGYKKQTLHLPMQGFALSEWGDLNSRPLDPQSSALTRLRYTPNK
jgi:hypothetical protein